MSDLDSTKPFASSAEVVRAISDARYRHDPAYRAAVARKVANSAVFVPQSNGSITISPLAGEPDSPFAGAEPPASAG